MSKEIDRLSVLLNSVRTHREVCTCLDFEEVIRAPGDAVSYLDPPYFEKGNDLYQVGFTRDDHERLASVLRREERPWLVSYDTHPEIHRLYSGWAHLRQFVMTCTMNGTNKKREFLISNRQFEPESSRPKRGKFSAITSRSPSLPYASVV